MKSESKPKLLCRCCGAPFIPSVKYGNHNVCGHVCSHPSFGPHDMGVIGNWKHDTYAKYYPDGFEVLWIENPTTDPLLQEAYAKHVAMGKEEYAERIKRIGEPDMPCVEVVVSDESGQEQTIKQNP